MNINQVVGQDSHTNKKGLENSPSEEPQKVKAIDLFAGNPGIKIENATVPDIPELPDSVSEMTEPQAEQEATELAKEKPKPKTKAAPRKGRKAKDAGMKRSFGITDDILSARAVPCTQEMLMEALKSPRVASVRRELLELEAKLLRKEISKEEYNQAAREAKLPLPALTPYGTYQGDVRKGEYLLDGGFGMLDVDHIPNVEAVAQRIWDLIQNSSELKKCVAFMQFSPRRDGLHFMYALPKPYCDDCKEKKQDFSLPMAWFANKIGVDKYDLSCSDRSRPMFLAPFEDVMIFNQELLFGFGPQPLIATQEERLAAEDLLKAKNVNPKKEAYSVQAKRDVEWNNTNLQTEYCGVLLTDIVDRYVQQVYGGEPSEGCRYNTLLKLTMAMAAICRFDPATLFSIAPKWGQEDKEIRRLVVGACQKANGYIIPSLDKVICDLRAEKAAAAQADVDIDEPTQADLYEMQKQRIFARLSAIVPKLAPALRSTLMPVPDFMQMPILVAAAPAMLAAADQTQVLGPEGKPLPMALHAVVAAPKSSNKSWCGMFVNEWISQFVEEDRISDERWDAYRNELRKCNGQDLPDEPLHTKRILDIQCTTQGYLKFAKNTPNHTLFMFHTEIDQLLSSNKQNNSDKTVLLRNAYDQDMYGQTRYSEDCLSVRVPAKLNISLTGTPRQFRNLFNEDNIENGMSDRFLVCTYKLDHYDNRLPVPVLTHEDKRIINEGVNILGAARGTIVLPRTLKAMDEWIEKVKAFAKKDGNDELVDIAGRAENDGVKLAALDFLLRGGEETDATVELAKITADLKLLEHYRYFGATMRKLRMDNDSFEATGGLAAPSKTLFDSLPTEFTYDQVMAARPNDTYESLRQTISRWKKAKDIEKIGNNRWRKKSTGLMP